MDCRTFPFVFSANQVRGDRRGPANLAVLCFGALLIGLFLALPFGHELFHEHGEAEPENCPVCMIESSLVLLVVVVLPLLFVSAGTRICRGLPGPSLCRFSSAATPSQTAPHPAPEHPHPLSR